jgi:hypothetical protein
MNFAGKKQREENHHEIVNQSKFKGEACNLNAWHSGGPMKSGFLLGLFFLFLSSSPIVLYTGVHHGRRVRVAAQSTDKISWFRSRWSLIVAAFPLSSKNKKLSKGGKKGQKKKMYAATPRILASRPSHFVRMSHLVMLLQHRSLRP